MTAKATGFYREVWLIVAGGGWWKQSEIISFLPDVMRIPDAHVRLRWMHKSGYLERRELPPEKRERVHDKGAPERLEYAVTPACMVPQGLTAGVLVRALTGEMRE